MRLPIVQESISVGCVPPAFVVPGARVYLADPPAGTSVSPAKYDKPVHSASHYGQWGHFFLVCGQTNSVENP